MNKVRQCEICGKTFEIIDRGWTRKYCYKCAPHEDENCSHAQAVTIKRRAIKQMLVNYAGGKCIRCGYNKCLNALQFHHRNPNEKDFGISDCLTKSITYLKQQIDKCDLVCANCHTEIHDELYEKNISSVQF